MVLSSHNQEYLVKLLVGYSHAQSLVLVKGHGRIECCPCVEVLPVLQLLDRVLSMPEKAFERLSSLFSVEVAGRRDLDSVLSQALDSILDSQVGNYRRGLQRSSTETGPSCVYHVAVFPSTTSRPLHSDILSSPLQRSQGRA